MPLRPAEIVAYLLASILLYLAGRYLYQRRQLEKAGSAIAFDAISPVFQYGVTFCFMLLAGSYFFSTQDKSAGWTYFGYFIGSLLAYFLSEILLKKSLYVFKLRALKGYGIYGLIVIVCISFLYLDLTGYEKRMPDLSEVDSIYYYDNFYPLQAQTASPTVYDYSVYNYWTIEMPLPIYKDEGNIASIYALHQKLVSNRRDEKAARVPAWDRRGFCLIYNLKNGSRICRQYNVLASNYTQELKPVHESLEYKNFHNPILRVDPSQIIRMEISATEANKSLIISDQKRIQQAAVALQNDVLNQTYTENSKKPGWAYIEITLENNRRANMAWEKSYVNFEQWLKIEGEDNNARLVPEDIQYAVVAKGLGAGNEALETMRAKDLEALENSPGSFKISDPEMLEDCLRCYERLSVHQQRPYIVVFRLKNGSSIIGIFSEADTPDFVREHLPLQDSGSIEE